MSKHSARRAGTNRWLIPVAVIVAAIAISVTAAVWPDQKIQNNFRVEQANATAETAEPEPLIPPGVKSWADVEAWIKRSDAGTAGNVVPPGYGDFLELRTGWSRDDIHNFVVAQNAGQPLTVFLKKGTVITNTGYSRRSKKFQVYNGFVLKKDRTVLVEPKGYVPIKQRRSGLRALLPALAMADGMQQGVSENCGNAVAFGQQPGVKRPGKQEKPAKPCPPQKPPRNKFPWTTPHHPGNPSTQPPGDNTEKAKPTPGVTPGVPEDTKQSQDDNRDTDGAVPGGKSGQDEGGTTNPDGSVTPAPAPTTPPDTTDDSVNHGDPGEPG